MRNYLALLVLFSSVSSSAAPKAVSTVSNVASVASIPERTLKYYELGKSNGPVIFTQKTQYQKAEDGILIAKSVTTDPKGNVMYTETIKSKGSFPFYQVADVSQTKRHLEMEVKDGKVHLRTKTLASDPKDGPKEEVESIPDHFMTGAMAETFAIEHFAELMAGDTIRAKMAILEIREMVSFKFWNKEITKYKDREVMVVAMKPSSIFISFLVDTIYLYIDVKDKKMIHYVGRTPLWKEVDGDLKALDAEIDLN